MEINIVVTIQNTDGETRYAAHANTIETAIDKLYAIERKIQKGETVVAEADDWEAKEQKILKEMKKERDDFSGATTGDR